MLTPSIPAAATAVPAPATIETLYAEAQRAACFAGSYSRMEVIASYFPRLPRLEWYRLLGEQWSVCDDISAWKVFLIPLLGRAQREELNAMMDAREREALAALPTKFTVYRGCYACNRRGLSWSTNRAIAETFPSLNRYRRRGDRPLLITGSVAKRQAVLKLDRDESEIIAAKVRVLREEPLPPIA